MPDLQIDPQRTALLIEIMQNEFTSPEGEFWKAGLNGESAVALIPAMTRVCEAARAARIPIFATKLTVFTDLDGRGIGIGHMATFRPFLARAGLRDGTWGHQITSDLPKPDYEFRKWAYSAFHRTEFDHMLSALGIEHLILVGIATNIAIESTGRDAVHRGMRITTVSDCVSSYVQALHDASLQNLANLGSVVASDELISALKSAHA
jgi:nicotinamidase-related amidase